MHGQEGNEIGAPDSASAGRSALNPTGLLLSDAARLHSAASWHAAVPLSDAELEAKRRELQRLTRN